MASVKLLTQTGSKFRNKKLFISEYLNAEKTKVNLCDKDGKLLIIGISTNLVSRY